MTMKYKFIMEDDEQNEFGPAREVVHTIIGEQSWPELLPFMEEWLRGIGFIFDGSLAMVDKDGAMIDV